MNTFSDFDRATLCAELDAMLAGGTITPTAVETKCPTSQQLALDAMSEKAIECDGDTVATINRKLDKVLATLDDSAKNDEIRAELLAVRHFHLPSLLDAFEVDTRRAH